MSSASGRDDACFRYRIDRFNGLRRWGSFTTTPATFLGLHHAPFLRQHFENFGRLISHDVLAFGHGTDEPPKNRQTPQLQIGAAIVNADLIVTIHQGIDGRVVSNHQGAVATSCDDSEGVFLGHDRIALGSALGEVPTQTMIRKLPR